MEDKNDQGGDRRRQLRCPVCQGPAVPDEHAPEGLRCRISVCIHNHAKVICPRCSKSDLEHVAYKDGVFSYACRECMHRWS